MVKLSWSWATGWRAARVPTQTRINMADAIQGAWEHVVITSFGVDLGFFERAILPQLAQTRGRLILADADHLLVHHADAARGRLVRHLNRGYHAGGVHVSGVAHAKLVLLVSETRGRLLVGSGNLRLTGWGSTGEMFTQYDFSDQDASDLAAFASARRFLDGLSVRHLLDDFSRAYLEQLWARVPWLDGDAAVEGPVHYNLERPLLDQFVDVVDSVGERPTELIMLAPFHDGRCQAIKQLLERTKPHQATLLVQPGRTSVDPAALRDVAASHPELAVKPFGPRGDHGRYVHAKLVLARFKKRTICLQGSANLSHAALMSTIPNGNVEVVNLLNGTPDAFDHLLADLWIGKAVSDVSALEVSFQPEPSLVEPGGNRIFEAIWDGELLTLVLSKSMASAPFMWLTMGTALVEAEVVNVQDSPIREGGVVLRVRPLQDVDDQFMRATPIALYLGEPPPDEDVGESDFTDPIFCVNQPVLIERLEGRPTAVHLRDVGVMALDDDRALEELLQALQSSMVYDRRTLMEVVPPPVPIDDPTDEQLGIAYAEIDYEELRRSHARLHQYEGALMSPGSVLGPIPTDIQLALRSITDAFGDVVGQQERTVTLVSFASEWSTEDETTDGIEDPAFIEENKEELEAVDQASDGELEDLEEAADRRWSNDARMRVHWRNFIDRFLRGLESPVWQELVGTAVLSGNYELFSHILQRLHRQKWQNFEFMEFLLQATVATHGFAWGRSGESEEGWLSSLSAPERQVVTSAFSERHLGVRLLVDLASTGELTHSDTFSLSSRLLDERRAARDVARAVFSSVAWGALVKAEPRFVVACQAVASELCAGDDFACWLEPPSFATLVDRIEELVSFTTVPELQRDVASLMGVSAQQVVLGQVELRPHGKKVISQDLAIERFNGDIDLQMALALMGRFVALHPGPRYRVHAGRARLLFNRESADLEWVAGLDEDIDLDPRDIPMIEAPWSSSIQALRALEHRAVQEAVA